MHYSDTWADPGKQHIPSAWGSISSAEAMEQKVYDYTYDVIGALKNVGATPDMVQVGNEITNGMLRHKPEFSDEWGNDTIPASMAVNGGMGRKEGVALTARYLKKGFEAVKAVSSSIVTMAHIESPQNETTMIWWMNSIIKDNGVLFDVMGFSGYTAYQHGTPDTWYNLINNLSRTYPNLKFVMAEYNGSSTKDAYNYNGDRAKTNTQLRELPAYAGSFFWEPGESGAWGGAMFDWNWNEKTLKAKTRDFQEFDNVKGQLGDNL